MPLTGNTAQLTYTSKPACSAPGLVHYLSSFFILYIYLLGLKPSWLYEGLSYPMGSGPCSRQPLHQLRYQLRPQLRV